MSYEAPNILLNERKNKLNGYLAMPKPLMFLLFNNVLSASEFSVYIGLASLTVFSLKSPNYSNVPFTTNELSAVLNKNTRTLRNILKSLCRKGFIAFTKGRKYIRIKLFPYIFERKFPVAKSVDKEVVIMRIYELLSANNCSEEEIIGTLNFEFGRSDNKNDGVNLYARNDKSVSFTDDDKHYIDNQLRKLEKGGDELP